MRAQQVQQIRIPDNRIDEIDTAARLSVKKLRQKAIHCHQQGDYNRAVHLYQASLKIAPQDIALWSNLGAALRKLKHYQSAVNCYRRALEAKPNDSSALGNLANVLKDLHRLDEAIAIHQDLLKQNPDNVSTLMNYAAALREAGEHEQGLTLLNHAKTIEPGNAGVEWERSQHLLYLGRYSEGWQAYEARWRTGDLPITNYGVPQWQGEPLTGKRILLHTEQGYGDTLLATRFIQQVKQKGATVLLRCKPELHRLFMSLGADELLNSTEKLNTALEGLDYHCPLMSLMGALATTPETIPPPSELFIPAAAKAAFSFVGQQTQHHLKVGIVWSGSVTFANNANRAVSIDHFLPLAEIPGIRLYSLQKGPCEKELYEANAHCIIEPLGSICRDFADTAAAISELDVIVMTDSSVAHLAASLDKPVINLLQKVPYWLYALEEETTPWYPSMTLIKQKHTGEWGAVFKQAKEKLITMRDIKRCGKTKAIVPSGTTTINKVVS